MLVDGASGHHLQPISTLNYPTRARIRSTMRRLDPGRGAAAVTTVRLREEQVDGLRLIVETEGCTQGDLIRAAVDLLLAERAHPAA
jgi:hypothetical protein